MTNITPGNKMQYAIHLFATARVKVTGIKASSVAEAVKLAEDGVNMHEVLDCNKTGVSNVECVEWDEGTNSAILIDLVNEKGEVIEGQSHWLDGFTGEPMVEGKTSFERKAASAEMSAKFFAEILECWEGLSDLQGEYGSETVREIAYLQYAIVTGGFIDYFPGSSSIMKVVKELPSADEWVKFIREVN
jgi:hypothetical protein